MTTPREDAIRIEADDSGYATLPDGSVFPVGRGHSVTVHPHESHTCRECGAVITVPYVRPTTPREDAIAAVRSNWPDDYTAAEAKAWIAACDRIEFALVAEAETPDRRTLGGEAGNRPPPPPPPDTVAGHPRFGHWVDLASPETAEALARALFITYRATFGAPDDEVWLEKAAAILAAMRETP